MIGRLFFTFEDSLFWIYFTPFHSEGQARTPGGGAPGQGGDQRLQRAPRPPPHGGTTSLQAIRLKSDLIQEQTEFFRLNMAQWRNNLEASKILKSNN